MKEIINKKIILLIALVFILYINVIHNDFVWDDYFGIVENDRIKDFSYQTVESCFIPGKIDSHTYLPISYLFYSFNYQLWKLNPSGYHGVALFLFILHVLLIYLLVLKLFNRENVAFLTSLFFVLHPIHVEVVAWISASMYLPTQILMFLSLLMFIFFLEAKIFYPFFILSIILYFLAAFFTHAMYYPLLILLYAFCFKKKKIKKVFICSIPYWIITFINVYIAFSVGSSGGRISIDKFVSFRELLTILGKYFYNLYAPISLSPFYPREELYEHSIFYITILFLTLFFIILLSVKSREYLFCWGWFFISLLPYSNIIPFNWTMADRYLYAPSFGFFLCAALLFDKLLFRLKKKFHKKLAYGVMVIIFLFYSIITVNMIAIWKNNLSLWQYAASKYPYCLYINKNLSTIYLRMDLPDKALDSYLKLVEISPEDSNVYSFAAEIYVQKEDYKEAVKYYKRAVELEPFSSDLHRDFALTYYNTGQSRSALDEYMKAWILDGSYRNFYGTLGMIYHRKGFLEKAILYYRRSLVLNPQLEDIQNLMYLSYLEKFFSHKIGSDNLEEKIAQTIKITNEKNNQALLYLAHGQENAGEKMLQEILKENPYSFEANYNLGLLYYNKKDFEKSIFYFKKALDLKPFSEETKSYLNRLVKYD